MKDKVQLFKGYRLLAVDGSDVQTASNPTDFESYIQGKDVKSVLFACNKIATIQHLYFQTCIVAYFFSPTGSIFNKHLHIITQIVSCPISDTISAVPQAIYLPQKLPPCISKTI